MSVGFAPTAQIVLTEPMSTRRPVGREFAGAVEDGIIRDMGEPVGFLITWTCYGRWVYGDDRGSVDDDHNVYGTPLIAESPRRVSGVRRRLRNRPFRLNEPARDVVKQTITEHSERRGWELLAVNVRSNHVHVVVRFAGVTPEVMMGQWKLWSSRRLRECGVAERGQSVWTRHGSTRYLWKEHELEPAVRYVVEGQDEDRFHDG